MSGIRLRLALEKRQLLDLWEIRNIIEVEMAGLAAERATAEEIQEILLASQKYHNEIVSGNREEETIKLTQSFHSAIAAASHNTILTLMIGDISSLLAFSRETSIQVEGSSERADTHHAVIARAIESRDAALARKAMRDHLLDVKHDLELYLEKQKENDNEASEKIDQR
jgi:GntR family transcriptional repressor for pyruvate dehydrogenase complex